ncbi:urea ABC transporter permease [Halobacteria archaeon AArc-m2/3/4]|uniref:Urea ABC transporter permease n=1 Tax=Natronoglomus mannanivorans TaxID=2979990 RepID=A0ABT2QEY7_9EURY|nr:urea ABC transporter permease [Halobacteria archaeon AArc-m2/3/4]
MTNTVLERLRAPFEGPNTTGNSTAFWVVLALGVVGLLAYPSIASGGAAENMSQYLAYAFLALSLCFIWGYCGILSFGQVAFFGVAGYTFGIVAINIGSYTGISLAVVVALFVATAFAAILGYFMFYGGVRDVYVTIITLVVAVILHRFMGQTAGSEWAVGDARLGGYNGMVGVPNDAIGFGSVGIDMTGTGLYYIMVGTLLATYLGLRALVNSQFGYAMVATREDEDRTAMFGYNTEFIKLATFTFGGTLAGLSGVLYMFYSPGGYINPDVFSVSAAALPVIWVSIGGRKSLIGAISAALVIQWFNNRIDGWLSTGFELPALTPSLELTTTTVVPGNEWSLVIIGSVLLFVILVMPEGVAPRIESTVHRVLERLERRREQRSQSADVEAETETEVPE